MQNNTKRNPNIDVRIQATVMAVKGKGKGRYQAEFKNNEQQDWDNIDSAIATYCIGLLCKMLHKEAQKTASF